MIIDLAKWGEMMLRRRGKRVGVGTVKSKVVPFRSAPEKWELPLMEIRSGMIVRVMVPIQVPRLVCVHKRSKTKGGVATATSSSGNVAAKQAVWVNKWHKVVVRAAGPYEIHFQQFPISHILVGEDIAMRARYVFANGWVRCGRTKTRVRVLSPDEAMLEVL